MAKFFNVTGPCIPTKHYMADISKQIAQIRKMVDAGEYFAINRARQFGKTTTLTALEKALKEDYLVIWLDFQALGSASYENENIFSLSFLELFFRELKRVHADKRQEMKDCMAEIQKVRREHPRKFDLMELFGQLLEICRTSEKPVVLMIDEVDSASNNQVFLDFLAQLRNYFLERDTKGVVTFQSVILTGVYDIKNLKRKIRPDESYKTNSPWNIAADFTLDMSLSRDGIAGMLAEYEKDYHTGMDI